MSRMDIAFAQPAQASSAPKPVLYREVLCTAGGQRNYIFLVDAGPCRAGWERYCELMEHDTGWLCLALHMELWHCSGGMACLTIPFRMAHTWQHTHMEAVHCRARAPVSDQSSSHPARNGTAESQASTMLPRSRPASLKHPACDARFFVGASCNLEAMFQHGWP